MHLPSLTLSVLLGTAYALPYAVENPQGASLAYAVLPRSAEPEAIADADPKTHHHHKDKDHKDKHHKEKHHKEKGDKLSRAAEPEALAEAEADPEAKKHHKEKEHKDKGDKQTREAEPEADPEAKKHHKDKHHKEKEHKDKNGCIPRTFHHCNKGECLMFQVYNCTIREGA